MSEVKNSSIVGKSQEAASQNIQKMLAIIDKQQAVLESDENNINFLARSIIQATLPHSDPKTLFFERKNGNFRLLLRGDPKYGLPYGTIPRLVLAWITTEAVRTKSRELVLGNSLSEFMRELDLVPTGGRWGSITRLKTQLHKLLSCAVTLEYSDKYTTLVNNTFPIEHSQIWWLPLKDHRTKTLFESTLILSEKFFEEIIRNPIPIRIETLRALKNSSMDLDVYFWVTMLNGRPNKIERLIPYEMLQDQFGVGYPKTAQGKSNFKQKFFESLNRVALAYPAALLLKDEGKFGLRYVPGEPDVPPKLILRS